MNKRRKRKPYRSVVREEAAKQTRLAVVAAGRDLFAKLGWAGTTMRAVAERADVSLKTVEALFGTKAALLEEVVQFVIRGDLDAIEMPRRDPIVQMEAAPDAATMLRLHARHLRTVNERSAAVAWAVEQAAPSEPAVAELWERMNANRAFAVRWAASALLAKNGRRAGIRRSAAEATFWVALDWGTYRTLTRYARLTPAGYEAWVRGYYAAAFLP